MSSWCKLFLLPVNIRQPIPSRIAFLLLDSICLREMITFAIKLLIKVLNYRRILCNGTKGNTARNQLHDIHANFSGGNVCLREKNLPLQIGPHYSIASPASKFRALPKQTSERFEGALIIISARLPVRASEGKLLLNRFNKPSKVYACNVWKKISGSLRIL